MNTQNHICPTERSWALNNKMRNLVQSPVKILGPYIKGGMNVVDLGCGPGFFTIPMARMVGDKGNVTAVDLQTGMLIKVKTRIAGTILENRIKFHQCTDNNIGLTGQYDFALAFYMVHEVPDKKSFINEVYSFLNNDGKFLFVEPKGHVSREKFDETVDMAINAGFKVSGRPSVVFSRAVLFDK